MTCIVFDGIELAADRMSSYVDSTAPANGECESCGTVAPRLTTKVTKIVLGVEGAKFNGETIVAMAASGRSDFCVGLMKTLNRNGSLTEFYRVALDIDLVTEFPEVEVLVITEKTYYLVAVNSKEYRVRAEPQLPVILGSSAIADFCMKSYHIPARLAVVLSATWTRGVGAGVQYLTVSDPSRTIKQYPPLENKMTTMMGVRRSIIGRVRVRDPLVTWKAHVSVSSGLETFLHSVA